MRVFQVKKIRVKNQYFGDINDYRKYGLIRLLSDKEHLPTAVCWMLTQNDERCDGRITKYLTTPETHRNYDPPLFDYLKRAVLDRKLKNVKAAQHIDCLHQCRFHDEILSDDAANRALYFKKFAKISKGCNLVFFDPDNGIEVKSKPYGRSDSSKYLYWREVVEFFIKGYSLLIYQHFPRKNRKQFIDTLVNEASRKIDSKEIFSFQTPRVLFLLFAQERDLKSIRKSTEKIHEIWGNEILYKIHH